MTYEIGVQPTITVEHYEVVMETSRLGLQSNSSRWRGVWNYPLSFIPLSFDDQDEASHFSKELNNIMTGNHVMCRSNDLTRLIQGSQMVEDQKGPIIRLVRTINFL